MYFILNENGQKVNIHVWFFAGLQCICDYIFGKSTKESLRILRVQNIYAAFYNLINSIMDLFDYMLLLKLRLVPNI